MFFIDLKGKYYLGLIKYKKVWVFYEGVYFCFKFLLFLFLYFCWNFFVKYLRNRV